MADQTGDGADRGERNALDLDALAVSDRFRLFNFTRRDDHVAYLWVLRALDRLRAVHQVQAHSDEVAAALAELAAFHDEAPRLDGSLREKLDALAEDGMVHRLEDASRAGSLARYRNRSLTASASRSSAFRSPRSAPSPVWSAIGWSHVPKLSGARSRRPAEATRPGLHARLRSSGVAHPG